MNNAFRSIGLQQARAYHCWTTSMHRRHPRERRERQPDIDIKSKSCILGGGSRMMREKNLGACCSVLYMPVCVCVVLNIRVSWNMHDVCLNLTPPPPSPTGQKQGPSSPHELTRIHTHRYNVAPRPYADECLSFREHNSHRRVIQREWGQTKRAREKGDVRRKKKKGEAGERLVRRRWRHAGEWRGWRSCPAIQ